MSRRRRELPSERRRVGFVRGPDGRAAWLLYAVDLGPLEEAAWNLEPFDGPPPPGLPDRTEEVQPSPPAGPPLPEDADLPTREAWVAALLRRAALDPLRALLSAARAAADPSQPFGHPAHALEFDAAELERLVADLETAERPGWEHALNIVRDVASAAANLGRLELLDPAATGHRVRRGGEKGATIAHAARVSAAKRIAAWKRALAAERRPDGTLPHGAISRIARALSARHGTSPDIERQYYYDHRDTLGL